MNYLNILDCSIADGEGIRVTLFVAGCSHHCPGCHNPESWSPLAGKPFTEDTKEKLYNLLDRPFVDGLTLSGGDPLFTSNIEEITQLCKDIKKKFPNKTIWLYTGYEYKEVKNLPIMRYLDVVIDGEYIERLRDITLPFRGSSNQKIIRLKK